MFYILYRLYFLQGICNITLQQTAKKALPKFYCQINVIKSEHTHIRTPRTHTHRQATAFVVARSIWQFFFSRLGKGDAETTAAAVAVAGGVAAAVDNYN